MDGMTINHFLWVLTMAHITRSCIFSDQVDSLLYNSLALERCLQQPPEAARREAIWFFWENGPESTGNYLASPESIYMQRHQDMDVTLW